MKAWIIGGNLGRAADCFTRMETARVKPNIRSFNTILSACARAGRASEAVSWLDKIAEHGLKPDAVSFSNALQACSHKKADVSLDVAEDLMARMQAANVSLGTREWRS